MTAGSAVSSSAATIEISAPDAMRPLCSSAETAFRTKSPAPALTATPAGGRTETAKWRTSSPRSSSG
jgi:hypothetical protein